MSRLSPLRAVRAIGGPLVFLALLAAASGGASAADLPPRLPLARTPTNTFDGMTVDQRSEALLDWFRAKYGERLKPETPLLTLMVRHLAETVVNDTKGQLRVHPDIWDVTLETYNACAQQFAAIHASQAPLAAKSFLCDWYGRLAFQLGETPDADEIKARLANLAADSRLVRVAGPDRLAEAIRAAEPAYADAPPLVRKIAMDRIVEWNPHVRSEGYRVSGRAENDPGDGVAVPLPGGRTQVFRYSVTDTNGPVVVPGGAQIAGWCKSPGHVDLRDFRDPSFDLLSGMAPESLDLAGTSVSNLAPLAAFRSLRSLNLASTPVRDLSPLAGMALESVDLSRTMVESVAPLKGLPLTRLLLAGTLVSDIGPLQGLPLKTLDIQDTLVSDLAPLRGMPLAEVLLSRRRFDNFDVLKALPGLRRVSDYTVSGWYEAARTNLWPEPVPVKLESMRGGGRIECRFVPDKADRPSENTALHFLFDRDGRLERAYGVILPASNVIYDFGPTVMGVSTGSFSCEAMVPVKTDKLTEYEYRFGGDVREDGTIEGWFKLRYEVEIQDPERGYFLVVHRPEGRMSARIVREAGAGYAGTTAPACDWPGWRGPLGDGRAGGETNLVTSLGEARLCWVSAEKTPASDAADGRQSIRQSRTGISGGYSGPVVYGGKVYLYYYQPSVGAYDERLAAHHPPLNGWDRRKWYVEADDVVLCLDARTGATAWKRVFARRGLNFNGLNQNRPYPMLTPCAADGRIFAMGVGGRVYALDAVSGDTVWQGNVGLRWDSMERARGRGLRTSRLPKYDRDFAGSPVVAGGRVVCSDHSAYLGSRGARQSGLIAFDKDTGATQWHVAGVCDMEVSPAVWRSGDRDHVLVSSEDAVRCLDAATGREEWTIRGARYPVLPGMGGGILAANDLKQESLRGYSLPPSGGEPVWTLGREFALRDGAPVVAGGLLWTRGDVGLGCVDLAQGRIAGTNVNIKATAGFVAAGDCVLTEGFVKFPPGVRGFAFGTVSNGMPGVSATWMVPRAFGTTPAIADGRLFYRGPNAIYCYDLRKTEKSESR